MWEVLALASSVLMVICMVFMRTAVNSTWRMVVACGGVISTGVAFVAWWAIPGAQWIALLCVVVYVGAVYMAAKAGRFNLEIS